jgi:hypothetical protein
MAEAKARRPRIAGLDYGIVALIAALLAVSAAVFLAR